MCASEVDQSTRESVLLRGMLKKSSVLASCIVRAIKLTTGIGPVEYIDADVALAPAHVPDGEYDLHFEGRVVKVRKMGDSWCSDAT